MMKSETLIRVIGVALFLRTAAAVRPVAPEHHHYKLIDMGTLGGTQSYFSDFYQGPTHLLNNSGTLVSWGDTSEPDPNSLAFLSSSSDFYEPLNQVRMRAFLWEKGAMKL